VLTDSDDAVYEYADTYSNLAHTGPMAVISAQFLGGSDAEVANAIAVDENGNQWIVGTTSSSDFEGTTAWYSASYHGGRDVFVAELSSEGALRWITYLGGSGDDYGCAIATGKGSGVFVTGYTDSTDFVGANNAYQGGAHDGFVATLCLGLGAAIQTG